MADPGCNGQTSLATVASLITERGSITDETLGGPDAAKEREIIESQRVQLTTYINDVTILFPYMQEANLFNRDDKDIISDPVTTTAKVDKFLDVMLTKGPKAIGVFHEALRATQHLHLFNYLAQLFTQAGIELPPSRQMKEEKEEEEDTILQKNNRHSRASYRRGNQSLTVRKRLDVMSRQCEKMQKEKDDLQKALGDRQKEIGSLLSTKEHVQSSLHVVTVKYEELLLQIAHWRSVLESDGSVKEWVKEREDIQAVYDQMEQDYNLQCSELNAARDRIAGLLVQLERSEQMVSLSQESCQTEKDVLKHKIAVNEGEIHRLLEKLDLVNGVGGGGGAGEEVESLEIRCEKHKREVEKSNDQVKDLKQRLEVAQKERKEALDELEILTTKLYYEKDRRRVAEKRLKKDDSSSTHSGPEVLPSPQAPKRSPIPEGWKGAVPGGGEEQLKAEVKVENLNIYMPTPEPDADLGMKLALGVVVEELKDGSLLHTHGVRVGDEISQLNCIKLSGDKDPLELVHRMLFSATATVTLTIRRQIPVSETPRTVHTLPTSLHPSSPHPSSPHPSPHHSPHPSHHPSSLSPHYLRSSSHPPPLTSPCSTLPLSPQLHAPLVMKKSALSNSLPASTSHSCPLSYPVSSSAILEQMQGMRNLSGGSSGTNSINKEFSPSSSSSEDDTARPLLRRRGRILSPIPYHPRKTSNSNSEGIVGSPTEKNSDWRGKRMTRFPTIETNCEFPITEDFKLENIGQTSFGNGDVGQWGEEGGEAVETEENEEEEEEEMARKKRKEKGIAQKQRHTGGQFGRTKAYYNKKGKSKSMDDLSENLSQVKKLPTRSEIRSVLVTQAVFDADIRLVGGRGYGIFVETDSKRLELETGDEILEIAEVSTHNMTHAKAIERILQCFQRHEPAPLLVRYNAKGLSELPTNAKDNFYVRCRVSYKPFHSKFCKNPELSFEKGDVLHVTNTLPTGPKGFWCAEKVSSMGMTLSSGLIPTSLTSDASEDGSNSIPRRLGLGSPRISRIVNIEHKSVGMATSVHTLYQPIRKVNEVVPPRPVVLLGALERDIRRQLVNYGCTENLKFCYSSREETSNLKQYDSDEVVEKIVVSGSEMISTVKHVEIISRKGYHCVLCVKPEDLSKPGLLEFLPIVLLMEAKNTRTITKLRQSAKLPQEGCTTPQEEMDYVAEIKQYHQYFTGYLELQSSMADVLKDLRTTISRQQKSIIWESDANF